MGLALRRRRAVEPRFKIRRFQALHVHAFCVLHFAVMPRVHLFVDEPVTGARFLYLP